MGILRTTARSTSVVEGRHKVLLPFSPTQETPHISGTYYNLSHTSTLQQVSLVAFEHLPVADGDLLEW